MSKFVHIYFMVLLLWWKTTASELNSCRTPNNETALCTQLYDCDVILKTVANKDPTTKKFFEASKCGDFMVCCGTVGNYTNPQNESLAKESHRDFVIRKLLPSRRVCGLQHTDDYFHNYTTTSVDEFPWLVHMVLFTYPRYQATCAGVIISKRYILTVKSEGFPRPQSIRLGQYNRYINDDCIETPYGPDCADPVIFVDMEEQFTFQEHLVLIRLKKNIDYSDFIRPICLPLNETKRPIVGNTILSSGWGNLSPLGGANEPKVKKKVYYTIADPPEDKINRSNDLVFVNFVNSTLGGNYCLGDQGGPLMYKGNNSQWFLEALIPDGFCNGTPAQKLTSEAVEWILSNMRP